MHEVKLNGILTNINDIKFNRTNKVVDFILNTEYNELYDLNWLSTKFNMNIDTLRRALKFKLPNNFIVLNNKIYFGNEKTINDLRKKVKGK